MTTHLKYLYLNDFKNVEVNHLEYGKKDISYTVLCEVKIISEKQLFTVDKR